MIRIETDRGGGGYVPAAPEKAHPQMEAAKEALNREACMCADVKEKKVEDVTKEVQEALKDTQKKVKRRNNIETAVGVACLVGILIALITTPVGIGLIVAGLGMVGVAVYAGGWAVALGTLLATPVGGVILDTRRHQFGRLTKDEAREKALTKALKDENYLRFLARHKNPTADIMLSKPFQELYRLEQQRAKNTEAIHTAEKKAEEMSTLAAKIKARNADKGFSNKEEMQSYLTLENKAAALKKRIAELEKQNTQDAAKAEKLRKANNFIKI